MCLLSSGDRVCSHRLVPWRPLPDPPGIISSSLTAASFANPCVRVPTGCQKDCRRASLRDARVHGLAAEEIAALPADPIRRHALMWCQGPDDRREVRLCSPCPSERHSAIERHRCRCHDERADCCCSAMSVRWSLHRYEHWQGGTGGTRRALLRYSDPRLGRRPRPEPTGTRATFSGGPTRKCRGGPRGPEWPAQPLNRYPAATPHSRATGTSLQQLGRFH